MHADQKIIQLLKACRAEELPALRRYVASPYVNRQPVLSALLDALWAHWPAFGPPVPDKSTVYAALFPGSSFDDKRWRYLLSDLCALVEDFWVDVQQRADLYDRACRRLAVLSDRGVDKAIQGAQRQVERVLGDAQYRDVAFFAFAHRYHDQQHQHLTRNRQRKHDDTLQQASDYLDRFYFLEKLRYACAMLERRQILQGQFREGIGEAWLQHLAEQAFFDEPLIRLYHLALRMQLDEQDERRYLLLRTALGQTDAAYPPDEQQAIYQMAINYCARKIRKGQAGYPEEALGLYTEGIVKGVLLHEGRLSPWTFTNVVKLALRLQRFEWLEGFMAAYSALLPDAYRDNVLHYNMAELYFYTNRLPQAQLELLQVEMTDLNYYLGARVLLAKIYTEQGEEEALLSLLAAFTVFLKRNKQISADLKQTYLNFCRILWQLVRAKPGRTAGLAAEIQDTALLTDRAWLMGRVRLLGRAG